MQYEEKKEKGGQGKEYRGADNKEHIFKLHVLDAVTVKREMRQLFGWNN